jgi:hypothetical protein
MILPDERDPRFITIRRGGSLEDGDHRLLAQWAAECAAHVLSLFEVLYPQEARPRRAIEAALRWANGEIGVTEAKAAAYHANAAARGLPEPAKYAAYSAGQAAATAHVAAHDLGAAAYAIRAIMSSVMAAGGADAAEAAEAVEAARMAERDWQIARLPPGIRELALDDQRKRNGICWGVFG